VLLTSDPQWLGSARTLCCAG